MAKHDGLRRLHTIPISDRPPHGPIASKIFFPLLMILGLFGIASTTIIATPLLLLPRGWGIGMMDAVVAYTKDGFGRLLIAIMVLFAPSTLHFTVDAPPHLDKLIERDNRGRIRKLNLPDRLVIMANHQAYTDWMYLWIMACYAGHASGVVILLKYSLRKVPILGWGMQRFFRFIFMKRSWAADKGHLTESLRQLGRDVTAPDSEEVLPLLPPLKRSPLWLLIFPEGTINSDEERPKSQRYAKKEDVDDFVGLLHPRSTGLLFCLRSLLVQIPDLQLLDVTIGYQDVPFGQYAQDYYGLMSIFYRSVPPPTVHIHLKLYSKLADPASTVPSLAIVDTEEGEPVPMATLDEARAFELWLRSIWADKEERLRQFCRDHRFVTGGVDEDAREVVKVRQIKLYHWASALGGGGGVALILLALGGIRLVT